MRRSPKWRADLGTDMWGGLVVLCVAYALSQFFRAFLPVLSIVLSEDIGITPQDLSQASGAWFLCFAAMQIPVGWALDRIGPRHTAGWLLLLGGGGGAVVFAWASAPWHVTAAMALIGIGCSPVLMASYFIFAREFPPASFATLAALMLGIGSLGNLIAAWPTAAMAELVGWRGTLLGLAAVSVAVAGGILVSVHDPVRLHVGTQGSLWSVLRLPALWAIFPLMFFSYAPAAGLRGAWIGPYMADVHGLTTEQIGTATLIMGAAMVAGALTYGPLDRLLGTRKWIVFGGNLAGLLSLAVLIRWAADSVALSVVLLAAIGFLGMSFPTIVAHGRSFFPPHLAGRGVTILNLFGIGGVGVMNVVTGELFAVTSAAHTPAAPYVAVFTALALTLALGLAVYIFSPDRTD